MAAKRKIDILSATAAHYTPAGIPVCSTSNSAAQCSTPREAFISTSLYNQPLKLASCKARPLQFVIHNLRRSFFLWEAIGTDRRCLRGRADAVRSCSGNIRYAGGEQSDRRLCLPNSTRSNNRKFGPSMQGCRFARSEGFMRDTRQVTSARSLDPLPHMLRLHAISSRIRCSWGRSSLSV